MLHVSFRLGTHGDDSNTTGEFRESFLEFFLVILAVGLLDMTTNLVDTRIHVGSLAATFNDGRRTFVHCDLFRLAELIKGDVFQLDPKIFADERSTGERGDITEHGLPSITKSRCFHCGHIEDTA